MFANGYVFPFLALQTLAFLHGTISLTNGRREQKSSVVVHFLPMGRKCVVRDLARTRKGGVLQTLFSPSLPPSILLTGRRPFPP